MDQDVEVRKRPVHNTHQQGWNPVTVVLVGAVLVASCIAWYFNSQLAISHVALQQLTAASHEKQTQHAKAMSIAKHRIEGLELAQKTSSEKEKTLEGQVMQLHEELTNAKHALHEEHVKSLRIHRDNVDLHRKLKIKSEELKVLEAQTGQFETEMNRLTKAIHKVQGEVQHDVDAATDYEVLYKKQKEQQQRQHKGTNHAASKKSNSGFKESVVSQASDVSEGSTAVIRGHGKVQPHSHDAWQQHGARLEAEKVISAGKEAGVTAAVVDGNAVVDDSSTEEEAATVASEGDENSDFSEEELNDAV
ncbi:hypothetical protein CEUSTIGMA_g8788.t1 [Chlamydomonas eustigma]|uniref:Uncharacterized protein n=1 Tax=Chlamydomonas eustigma TaxID=1157962 RepID=A0A250XE45_9CHLO|nr:hypothetical protein CEUSTIGMA_g8788.t1 [Chlamydomonas eustigma]|eukprot:GAX81357.1 hypothetical protein CEUSTIGMA_g8788.t1 [Chlamydomonas eustigma]